MATLKQRLHKKNSSGGYDLIHLETEASMVLMSNGSTVEEAVNGKAPTAHTHDASSITTSSGTIEDAIAPIAQYQKHWWRRQSYRYDASISASNSVQLAYVDGNHENITTRYSDSYEIDPVTGIVLLGSPISRVTYTTASYTAANVLKGKYIYYNNRGTEDNAFVIYIPSTATISSSTFYIQASSANYIRPRITYDTDGTYLQGDTADAFPSGKDGSYDYQYLNIPFDLKNRTRFIINTYQGTGLYGEDNPTVLTFEFPPQIIFIFETRYGRMATNTTSNYGATSPMIYAPQLLSEEYAILTSYYYSNYNNLYAKRDASGKTISFYNNTDVYNQFNAAMLYTVMAIG